MSTDFYKGQEYSRGSFGQIDLAGLPLTSLSTHFDEGTSGTLEDRKPEAQANFNEGISNTKDQVSKKGLKCITEEIAKVRAQ